MQAIGELAGLFGIAVVIVDRSGAGLAVNSRWAGWVGSCHKAAARHWLSAFAMEDRFKVEEAWQDARRDGEASLECRFLKYDGTKLFVQLAIFGIVAPSGAPVVVGASDITCMRRIATQSERAALSTIESLSKMSAVRDLYTAGHQNRVSALAAAIGEHLGLDESRLAGLRIAATLHDIGKIGTPIGILTKPAKLTPGELALVREHTVHGHAILKDVAPEWPLARVAHEHHERIDGSGYPQGLRGDDILLEARITAVADVFDAMAVHRPYRSGWGVDVALEEIRTGRGRLYDADAASACIALIEGGFTVSPDNVCLQAAG
jgi:HD-GYP domain-containing protein (c-di-GMP phosphodiesterase class II)